MTKPLLVAKATTDEEIITHIYMICGIKVMLDRDLAEMYGVEVRTLNQSVKRNQSRFPDDFMFQLTKDEWTELITICDKLPTNLKFSPANPYAFTEQGVAMLSSVLRSERAIQVNIQIIRVYTKMRQLLIDNKDLWQRIEGIERRMNEKDEEVQAIFAALKRFLIREEKPRPRIGFALPPKKKKK